MTDAQLRASVRELMTLGNLPDERPRLHQAGGGPSRLAPQSNVCLICGEPGPNVTYVWSGDRVANLHAGVTWHALRHTFASRLVAAGVDLRTVQELGGWRTLRMVQRYTHLFPGHLVAAVEKIVAAPAVVVSETASVGELRQNFDSVEAAIRDGGMRH